MRRSHLQAALLAVALVWLPQSAQAVPLLQLDIQDGWYDFGTQTIIASANPFMLYAVATPNGEGQGANYTLERLLSETFYISLAVVPQVGPVGANLGSFTVNGDQIDVTAEMTYGVPPIEEYAALQGFDRGDLQGHGIYPTYFTQFAFQFTDTPATRVNTYNTADDPGGTRQLIGLERLSGT